MCIVLLGPLFDMSMGCSIPVRLKLYSLLGEVVPDDLQGLYGMFVWLSVFLGEHGEHAGLVQY